MGPTDRVVVLIDMDCFYCQVEEKLNPKLKGQPIAVVQYNAWRGGGIIAVNYPARDQGVTRHMRGNDAKKKCPNIILARVPEVRGKADLTKYRDAGKEVADVLATFTPLLERASVDEAYLDITELVEKRIEANLSDLTLNNLNNTFIVGCETKDFLNSVTRNMEFSEDNLKLAVGGLITEEIRREVYNRTGYKCSAGIAHNKILAKLVCSLHKPNKQTILPHEAIDDFFQTIPINKIKSLGGKFGQTLIEDLNITYMGQLKKFTEKELTQRYDDKTASWLYNIARGIDFEPVTTKLISKSIACCKNFSGRSALTTAEDVQHWLNELAAELAERLNKDLKENNRKAKQIVVSFTQEIKNKDVNSSRTQALTSYDQPKIVQAAFEVLKKFCLRTDGTFHLKYLGLSAGHFEEIKKVREITSFFKLSSTDNKKIESKEIASSSQFNSSVNEPSYVTDENVDPLEYETNENVYTALTQELEENVNDLIFYDDSFRIKQDPGKKESFLSPIQTDNEKVDVKTPCRKACKGTKRLSDGTLSSFFKQYFDHGDANNFSEVNTEEVLFEDSSNQDLFEICSECNKSIIVSELQSHKDYHFALRLRNNENEQVNNSKTITSHKAKDTNKKNSGNKDLLSFLKKDVVDDSSELTETCSECNKKIRIEDLNSHMDYHIAKKVHLEINSIGSKQTVNKRKKTTTKSKNINNYTVTSFFKPK